MNFKKIFAGLAAVGAVIGIAITHNIDAILKEPSVIGSVVFIAISSFLLGHDAGTPTPPSTP